MKMKKTGQEGFSLVELMVVVAIIGVLASIAAPKFTMYRAKAGQAEAKTNLGHMTTLQRSFSVENGTYGTEAQIGWTPPTLAQSSYVYSTVGGAAPAGGVSTATTAGAGILLCPTMVGADIWTQEAETGAMERDAASNFTCP
jgi:type IV pilus assembly protein PilA